MLKYSFTAIYNDHSPTPAQVKKWADAVCTAVASSGTCAVVQQYPVLGIVLFLVGFFGRILAEGFHDAR